MPIHRGTTGDWSQLIYRTDTRDPERVTRMVYEVATFQALREQLRCQESWVVRADSWRNPEQDLPADLDQRRDVNYRELRKPLDPGVFMTSCVANLVYVNTLLLQDVLAEDEWPACSPTTTDAA